MPRDAWICEHCFMPYETREAAETCERYHHVDAPLEIVGRFYNKEQRMPDNYLPAILHVRMRGRHLEGITIGRSNVILTYELKSHKFVMEDDDE